MKLQQLSVFLENKAGALTAPCKALAAAGIDIITLSLADTQQFGILRLIVKEPAKARAVLEKAGSVVKTTDVVAIEVADRPGGLADVLEAIEGGSLNIEYMYAFTFRRGGGDKAVLVFRFDAPDQAIRLLQSKGISVVGSGELTQK